MSTNNQITDKTNFKLEPAIPAGQKYNAVEFNTIKNFQNSPIQKLTTLDDSNVLLDGSKSYSNTIVETGSTRTITAAVSGHLEGNVIKVRYQFDVDCTITLANFDTTGNQTGIIAPIKAGTYDFNFCATATGINLYIQGNATALSDGEGTTANGRAVDIGGALTGITLISKTDGDAVKSLKWETANVIIFYQDTVAGITNAAWVDENFAMLQSLGPGNLHANIYVEKDGYAKTGNNGSGTFKGLKYKDASSVSAIDWETDPNEGLLIPHQDRVRELIGGLQTKIIEIGNWDMDANASPSLITHGLDITKIREVQCLIINDSDGVISQLDRYVSGGSSGVISITAPNIILSRIGGGEYDSTNYDTAPKNRGWVTIKYVV